MKLVHDKIFVDEIPSQCGEDCQFFSLSTEWCHLLDTDVNEYYHTSFNIDIHPECKLALVGF